MDSSVRLFYETVLRKNLNLYQSFVGRAFDDTSTYHIYYYFLLATAFVENVSTPTNHDKKIFYLFIFLIC